MSSVGAAKHPKRAERCRCRSSTVPRRAPRLQPFTIWSIVGGASFSRASEIAWEEYYRAIEGRSLRPLFVDAIRFLPTQRADDHALVAIDLGCGDGSETLALLARGWTVTAVDGAAEAIARVRASVAPEHSARLTTVVAPFHELELPETDFVYAGLSLPFCDPREFGFVWRGISGALRPRGVFAGHFFGPLDSWAWYVGHDIPHTCRGGSTLWPVRCSTAPRAGRRRRCRERAEALARVPRDRVQARSRLTDRARRRDADGRASRADAELILVYGALPLEGDVHGVDAAWTRASSLSPRQSTENASSREKMKPSDGLEPSTSSLPRPLAGGRID